MNIRTLYLTLKTDKPVMEDASKLRGYMGNRFRDYPILHNHTNKGYYYKYPKIQYKVLNGLPMILGIEEGVEVLQEIVGDLHEIILNGNCYPITEVEMKRLKTEIGLTKENHHYDFLSPWLALNQENWDLFSQMNTWKDKKEFLNGIMIGNILSMCKGLEYVVEKKLYVHSFVERKVVEFKGIMLNGFCGEFKVNFKIPDFLGIGKGITHGFGVVKSQNQQK